MSDPFFQQLFADRIGGAQYGKGTDIYKFEKIKRAKRQALDDYPDQSIIDFGIGENDSMAPAAVREQMGHEINQPENRGYADNGIAEFKEAAADFMKRNFAVELDPATEVQIYASDAATSDRFGYAVSGGKDINGDGYDDMVVGAPFADTNEGAIYVFRGGESGFDPTLERKTRHYLGPDMMWFGLSVALLDDTDGDAIPDVAAGAPPALAPEACSTEARGAAAFPAPPLFTC